MKFASFLQRILPPVWLGMVAAVAIEAQLKFQAPGITRELGLGIGKLVFTALNRAEIFFGILLLASFFLAGSHKKAQIIFSSVLLILLTQTFWLLPGLVERIDQITSGNPPPDSSLHIFYIVLEVAKILLLLVLTFLFNWQTERNERY